MKIHDNIVDEFNQFSSNYTRDMEKMVPHYKKLLQAIPKSVPPAFIPEVILDFGCGNGNVTHELIQIFPTARYILVDASTEMLNICRQRFSGYHVEFVESLFQNCDFVSGSIDFIATSFSLHHLDKKGKSEIFFKFFDWLRENGLFSSSDLMIDREEDPNHPNLIKEWEFYAKSNEATQDEWDWIMQHYNTFDFPTSFDTQKSLLDSCGFRLTNISWQKGYWVNYLAQK